jgi:thiamine-phosphate pyrophosphorylase
MKNSQHPLDRVIDANLNRLREGVRVVEDMLRYIYNEKAIASSLKSIRHRVRSSRAFEALMQRDAQGDVLRPTQAQERSRADVSSVVTANFKRAQESARVLEESLKLLSSQEAENFKQIRYELYTLEKETLSVLRVGPPPSPPQS